MKQDSNLHWRCFKPLLYHWSYSSLVVWVAGFEPAKPFKAMVLQTIATLPLRRTHFGVFVFGIMMGAGGDRTLIARFTSGYSAIELQAPCLKSNPDWIWTNNLLCQKQTHCRCATGLFVIKKPVVCWRPASTYIHKRYLCALKSKSLINIFIAMPNR
jgi:hypothetical protein